MRNRRRKSHRTRKSNLQAILLTDWLKHKPYQNHTTYDVFYTGIANKIYLVVQPLDKLFAKPLGKDQLSTIAINLTQYFEDFASEIGVWKAFQRMNHELYGFVLPFYELEIYDEEEINPEDICFLLWHYISCFHDTIYAPNIPELKEISLQIYDILDQYEELPATNFYKEFYSVKETDSYFEIKTKVNILANKSFLLNIESRLFFEGQLEEVNEEMLHNLGLDQVGYMIQEIVLFKHRFNLNAKTALEFFAAIAICDESTRQQILNTGNRATGYFIYRDTIELFHHFEHQNTKRIFEVWTESMEGDRSKMKNGDIFLMDLVPWDNKWWLSGTMMGGAYKEDGELDLSTANFSFYSYKEEDQQRLIEGTLLTQKTFEDTFNGSIYHSPDKAELLEKYEVFQRNNTDAIVEKAETEFSKEELEQNIVQSMKVIQKHFNELSGGIAIVFIENQGMLFQPDYGAAVGLLEKSVLSKEEMEKLYDLLIITFHQKVTVHFLEQYPDATIIFPAGSFDFDVRKYWKFFHRLEDASNYKVATPNMRIVG